MKMIKENKVKKIRSRTRRKEENSKQGLEPMLLPHLPEEIIFEIASRLPLGYRLKLRCICKSWSIRFNKPKPKSLVLKGGNNEVYTLDNDLLTSPLLDGKVVRSDKLESSLASRALVTTKCYFVGSCNGLICLRIPGKLFYLWNPLTTEYKLLPRPPSEIFRYSSVNLHGFGYDSKSDDYKLVLVSAGNFDPSKGIIYSIRSNVWHQIQPIPCKFNIVRPQVYGVFCNGALHWFAEARSGQYTFPFEAVFALDMTNEITREIPNPDDPKFNYKDKHICVLDGCLCMLLSYYYTGFDVWVMKDYGNKDSWTKIYFISKLKLPKKLKRIEYLTRIECLKTGELLLEVKLDYTKALVLYNPKNDRAKVINFKKNQGSLCSKSLFQTYEKSLVPLHSGTYFGDNVPLQEDKYSEDEFLDEEEILDEDEILDI